MNAYAVAIALCGLFLLTDAYPMLSMPQFPAPVYDSKIKRNNAGFPITDDEVLQLEHLKGDEAHVHHENSTPVTSAPNVEKLPDLEHQLESAKPNAGINPPHAPHAASGHVPHDHNVEITTLGPNVNGAGPSIAKQFHGAARLTFGQNPEVLPTPSTTSTTSTVPTTITTTSTITTSANDFAETKVEAEGEAEDVTSLFVQIPSSDTSDTTISMSDLEKNHNIQHGEQDESEQPKSIDVETNVNVSPLNVEEAPEVDLLKTAKTAARRSASIMSSKDAKRLLEHRDGQYSAFDMAQFVFWTGDDTFIARAVEELIEQGLMTRENALKFLREIRLGVEYLERSYANRVMPVDFRQNHVKKSYTMHPHIVTPSTTTERITIPTEKPLNAFVPVWRNSKQFDSAATWSKLQELNANEGGSEAGDYDEASGRAKIAEFLYTEYTLEEILYKLAKVMFTQSLAHGSDEAQKELQKLTDFLEREGKLGVIPIDLQKKVLNTLLTALSDTLSEHPELLSAARSNLAVPYNKIEE